MTTLDDQILALTNAVMTGEHGLDDALDDIEHWLREHAHWLSDDDRADFRTTLDRESSNSDRSLVDSVLRLHATRLLYRFDTANIAADSPDEDSTPYSEARDAFNDALRESEEGIREARIDIAISNAHHLLGNVHANRAWLDAALSRVQPLASLDLVRLAESVPPMPAPPMGALKRMGLRLMGVNLERLADRNRESFSTLAQLQTNQIILLAHLIGTSFEALRERQRANRAFRIVAHLVTRHEGMPGEDAEQALQIAQDIRRAEADAAALLARQAYALYRAAGDTEGQARAQTLLGR